MPQKNEFKYDVFLSHSANDKDIVRDIANRLKSDGVRVWFDDWEIQPGDSIPAKIEDGLEQSRVLVLCLSQAALAADWPQLESHTFRFKDPLNHDRRFIPLRLDDAPTKGSLAQFSYIDWRPVEREQAYLRLLKVCKLVTNHASDRSPDSIRGLKVNAYAFGDSDTVIAATDEKILVVDISSHQVTNSFHAPGGQVTCLALCRESGIVYSGHSDSTIRRWDIRDGTCLSVLDCWPSGRREVWNSIRGVLVSKDANWLMCWSGSTVCVWDLVAKRLFQRLDCHEWGYCFLAVACVSDFSIAVLSALNNHNDTTMAAFRPKAAHVKFSRELESWHCGFTTCAHLRTDPPTLFYGSDTKIETWNMEPSTNKGTLEGHTGVIRAMSLDITQRYLVSGSADFTVRLWDLKCCRCLCTLEGHTAEIVATAWDNEGAHFYSGDTNGNIQKHILSSVIARARQANGNVHYTSAKVLLVGNSAAGKTGLSNRLALDNYKETDSTVGAWATQWKLPLPEGDAGENVAWARSPSTGDGDDTDTFGQSIQAKNVEREVWLWDFGGQSDQRLIHQLYMDQTQVAALVFDPQKDDVFETLGQWDRDLSRVDKNKLDRDSDGSGGARMTKLLVAGRCDAGGLRVDRRQIDDFVAERGYAAYLETSAKKDIGCAELKQAIINGIHWENIPRRSSPVLFKRLKDEIIKLKDEGRVLMRFKELREVLALRMSTREPTALAAGGAGESVASEALAASAVGSRDRFTDAELKAVIGLLAGPGVVWELEFGSWVLLQPERINAYAQAVIATIRQDEHDRGCISEQRVLKGGLTYHSSIDRLPRDEEQFVLLAMHQILVERGLCIRHQTETGEMLLIFPSYYRRERRDLVTAPSVVVSYRFNGFLDDVYATLVVKLEHTTEFNHDELWRYAADFKTNDGKQLGVKLTRRAEGEGELDVYFASDVKLGERIIFSKYIHEHLLHTANDVVRLRHYVCHNKYRGGLCNTTANREVAMERLEEFGQHATITCQRCNETLELWDELERQFADPATKQRVQDLRAAVEIVLDTESKERVLVGEVISTVALAGQICREVQVSDWGIDAEIEFKDDNGNATARKVYLQLKSGDSFLTTRQRDNAEIFKSFNQRQADYWMKHEFPVILIIRNSAGTIRWMEVRDYLRQATDDGKRQVRQIDFTGNRFDVMSVRRWREHALSLE